MFRGVSKKKRKYFVSLFSFSPFFYFFPFPKRQNFILNLVFKFFFFTNEFTISFVKNKTKIYRTKEHALRKIDRNVEFLLRKQWILVELYIRCLVWMIEKHLKEKYERNLKYLSRIRYQKTLTRGYCFYPFFGTKSEWKKNFLPVTFSSSDCCRRILIIQEGKFVNGMETGKCRTFPGIPWNFQNSSKTI